MTKILEKSEKPKNHTAKEGNIQGDPVSARGSGPSYLMQHCSYSIWLFLKDRSAYLVWSICNRCHKLTERHNEETQQGNRNCQVHLTRMCWRERVPDEENERGKARRNIFSCKGSFFKAINVVKVVLVNKKETRISKQLTVRLCRCIR
jgi:hypothetical protein